MLKFNIQNQIITRTDSFVPVGDSKNYLKATFTFSDEWMGEVVAIFGFNGAFYHALLDDNNECIVPWEVIKPPFFTVSAFCGDLITSNVVTVRTVKSGFVDGEVPGTPSPTVWEQYHKKYLEALEKALENIGSATVNPEDIKAVVNEYLEENPVETTPIDGTLTKQGEAADAKAAGDVLRSKADRALYYDNDPEKQNPFGFAAGGYNVAEVGGITIGFATATVNGGDIAIGSNSNATADRAIAFGALAKAYAERTVQIGQGENETPNTVQFFNYRLLDEEGHIPDDRLPQLGGISEVLENIIALQNSYMGGESV